MKVRLTLRALRDIENAAAHINLRNSHAAKRLRDDLQAALSLLSTHPLAGRTLAGGRRRFTLRRFPYLIFYRIRHASGVVEVTTIRHGARKPDEII